MTLFFLSVECQMDQKSTIVQLTSHDIGHRGSAIMLSLYKLTWTDKWMNRKRHAPQKKNDHYAPLLRIKDNQPKAIQQSL